MTLPELATSTITWTLPPVESTPAPTKKKPDSITVESPTQKTSPSPEKEYRLCSPLADHKIYNLTEIVSDPYRPPPDGKDDRHQGVDFSYYNHAGRESIAGEGVQAILHGRIAAVIENRLPYGNMVMIETPRDLLWPESIADLDIRPGESIYHLYAHFSHPPDVLPGQWVDCGQHIGEVGKTGYNIVVPHLHMEIRIGPESSNFQTMAFYDTRATEEEMNNYKLWRMRGDFRHFDPIFLFTTYGAERAND